MNAPVTTRHLMAFTICALLYFISCQELGALTPGMKLPEIYAAKWYFQGQGRGGEGAVKAGLMPYEVVLLFDVDASGAESFLALLESLADLATPEAPLKIRAVARNSPETLDQFFSRTGPLSIPVAADDRQRTFKEMADTESILPFAIVAKPGGAVAWTGHPADIVTVLSMLEDGSFRMEDQRRINALRNELQAAIRTGVTEAVIKTADKILELAPRDSIAIQAKLFACESKGDSKSGLDFMKGLCSKFPKDENLRLTLLDFIIRAGELSVLEPESASFLKDFQDSPPALGKLAGLLLSNSPFAALPMEAALKSSSSYLAHCKGKGESCRASKLAEAYELCAKSSYFAGCLSAAVDAQTQACALRKGSPLEQPAAKLLDYYKAALALQR